MKPLYIFDIDGTLTDLTHRRHLVDGSQKKDWDEFYRLCFLDVPRPNVIAIMSSLMYADSDVIFFSGRRESCRKDTLDWFCKYIPALAVIPAVLLNNMLTLRPNGDYTHDTTLKQYWYNELPNEDKLRLVAVFDDRQQVVDMWRTENILCCQVDKGDF